MHPAGIAEDTAASLHSSPFQTGGLTGRPFSLSGFVVTILSTNRSAFAGLRLLRE